MNTATLLELDANDPIWDDVWHLVRKRLMQVEYAENGKAPHRLTKDGLRALEQLDND